MGKIISIADRFWKKVDKNGPLPDQANPHYIGLNKCWTWTGGSKTRQGYGQIYLTTGISKRSSSGRARTGTMKKAHKVAFELAFGPIPKSQHVLHRCDNPSCVNPYHLFLGTNHDNVRDSVAKGRFKDSRGEKHGMAKLVEANVLEIRGSDLSSRELSCKFSVTKETINMIRSRTTWKHI